MNFLSFLTYGSLIRIIGVRVYCNNGSIIDFAQLDVHKCGESYTDYEIALEHVPDMILLQFYSYNDAALYHSRLDLTEIEERDCLKIVFMSCGGYVVLAGNRKRVRYISEFSSTSYHSQKHLGHSDLYNSTLYLPYENRNLINQINYTKIQRYAYRIHFEMLGGMTNNSAFMTVNPSADAPVYDSAAFQIKVRCIAYHDASYDFSNDLSYLSLYHVAAIPMRLAVEWSGNKVVYSAYYWMEEEQLVAIFEKFFGAHPETKTDFIIRIDAENKKYELALYRHGLKEPVVIPEAAYQLIVFKNKFEDYRSENYNQPRGAWIW